MAADEDHGCGDLPEDACRDVPGNAVRIIIAQTLQNVGDRVVDAKTVLPWLLAAVGAPAGIVGLLVPIREAGSLLPQAALVPWVRRQPARKWVWVAGSAGQALAVATMALIAASTSGSTAAFGVLGTLAFFAVSRALSSIASKDVLGRTVPKGRRGMINGWAVVTSGAVAISLGLGIRTLGGEGAHPGVLVAMLAGAALVWVAALAVFATIREPVRGVDAPVEVSWVMRSYRLLRADVPFRRFVLVRGLLLVSALSPPFVVTLAAQEADAGLGNLGPFLIASGLAGLLTGRAFGRVADRSSRMLMITGAASASLIIILLLGLRTVPGMRNEWWLYPVAYLMLMLAHTGVRIARKTYVIDLARGDQRTDYVAVSNTVSGGLLLVTGAISSGLAYLGIGVALVFLAALGLLGVIVGRSLPDVSVPG